MHLLRHLLLPGSDSSTGESLLGWVYLRVCRAGLTTEKRGHLTGRRPSQGQLQLHKHVSSKIIVVVFLTLFEKDFLQPCRAISHMCAVVLCFFSSARSRRT